MKPHFSKHLLSGAAGHSRSMSSRSLLAEEYPYVYARITGRAMLFAGPVNFENNSTTHNLE